MCNSLQDIVLITKNVKTFENHLDKHLKDKKCTCDTRNSTSVISDDVTEPNIEEQTDVLRAFRNTLVDLGKIHYKLAFNNV